MTTEPHECNQEQRIVAIERQGTETHATVKEIHKRLFVDNGKDSFQTSLQKGVARFDAVELAQSLMAKEQERQAKDLAELKQDKQRLIGASAVAGSIFGGLLTIVGKVLLVKVGWANQ